jgi:AhpD family alkylhydroperoxidase
MAQRLNYGQVAPGAIAAMRNLGRYLSSSGLEHSVLHLVKLRASQINGCAYCVDMHTKDARADGETEQRLYAVAVWRDAPFFTERERAALAWTDALTRVSEGGVSDELYRSVLKHFSEKELVDLTMAVVAINGWNRLNAAFQPPVGGYQPGVAPVVTEQLAS